MSISPPDATLESVATAHLAAHSPEQIDAFLRCTSIELLRQSFRAAGIAGSFDDDAAVLEAYLTRDECKAFSGNALFDEAWYRVRYPDIAASVRSGGPPGLAHFVRYGLGESRWPNESMELAAKLRRHPGPAVAALDAERYLRLNAGARAFLEAFPVLTALEHYNRYGRMQHFALEVPSDVPALDARRAIVTLMESEFDPVYYRRTYLANTGPNAPDPFRHYLTIGIEREYSPNAWFSEDWYRAYYADVRAAIPGEVLCGFHHYLVRGRAEQRMPRFDLAAALEGRLPGVTAPVLVPRTEHLRNRLFGNGVRAFRLPAEEARRTIWFLLPTLNPDIAFGGYRAAYELICALRAAAYDVAIYCTEDAAPNKGYFLWRERSPKLHAAFEEVTVLARQQDDQVGIGPRDRIIVYTVWDLHCGAAFARWTDFGRPFLLAQEYEPVFFDNSSSKVLCREAYSVPHYPIINSAPLRDYFRENRIGIFAGDGPCDEFEHYGIFEHRINQLPRQTIESMRARRQKTLALYARPEVHASRNLFELTLLALRNLCAAGAFGDEWSFIGLGALSDVPPVDLGGGHRLILRQRTTEEEYRELLESLDIGISMMYAPHPGVVALEFATTGALVVTNVYENRSAGDLRRLSANIVPCEASLRDLERAIVAAVELTGDHAARERNAYRPVLRTWDEIFSRDFVERTLRLDA